ncbi:MAG: PHP domain-containing protein [Clostridia bacterium]|nr:PHP domain-containing protein [Clostridia bacterium]
MYDLHIHSNYSDSTDSVEKIIDKVGKTKIKYFSITDHDSAESAREINSSEKLQNKIKEKGLTYVPGVEFTCTFMGRDVHILAYDFDPNSPTIQHFENEFKNLLKEKDEIRRKAIEDMGYKFSPESIAFMNSCENLRKPDVANCMVNDGHFSNISDAIEKVIDKIEYDETFRLKGEEVISKLSSEGVKMVWAHPYYGLGDEPLTVEQTEFLATEMKKLGLSGLECFYSLYDNEQIKGLTNIADKLGLFVTSGSDYHGRNKDVNLAEISSDGTKDTKNKVKVDKIFVNTISLDEMCFE